MTTYHVAYRVPATGAEGQASFDSMLERALFVISISPYVTILREWLE